MQHREFLESPISVENVAISAKTCPNFDQNHGDSSRKMPRFQLKILNKRRTNCSWMGTTGCSKADLPGLLHSIWLTLISQFLVVLVAVKAKFRVAVSVARFPMST
jgi:hypothetical protein